MYLNLQCKVGVTDAPVGERSGQEADVFEFNTYRFFKLGEILKTKNNDSLISN